MEYLSLIILWSLWCVIHSCMISLKVVNYLKNRLGNYYKFYRIFFNTVALTTFIPLAIYSRSFKGVVLFSWEGYLTIIQITLLIFVVFLLISGGLKYDILQFLGIKQIKSGKSHTTLSEIGNLNTSGILGVSRHPWYLAGIILIWVDSREIDVSALIVNAILTIYIVIGTVLEERKLVKEFGDDYLNYQYEVSMLFPFKWIFKKLSFG
ncbi:methyltransferase family protein [Bacteroidota bacterium]